MVDDYTLLAKTHGMTFTVNTEPTTIRANRDMMRHVISNLVSNAVRHGDAESVIKITCDQHELAIENACKPLTKRQLQHIFDPFYRSNAATKQHADRRAMWKRILIKFPVTSMYKSPDWCFDHSLDRKSVV